MRISIWQQFSSNHSGIFTVIGRFATEEEAEAVVERLLQWVSEIRKGLQHSGPSEAELKISQEYNLEWYKNGIRWNGWPNDISKVVRRTGNDVAFICPSETYDVPIPFVGLMWKLGARKVEYAYNEHLCLWADLTCEAPDENTAIAFCDHTTAYFKHELHATAYHEPLWSIEHNDDTLSFGDIHRDGTKIKMRVQFYEMGYGIYALVSYLKKNGFKNIDYGFFQDREWSHYHKGEY